MSCTLTPFSRASSILRKPQDIAHRPLVPCSMIRLLLLLAVVDPFEQLSRPQLLEQVSIPLTLQPSLRWHQTCLSHLFWTLRVAPHQLPRHPALRYRPTRSLGQSLRQLVGIPKLRKNELTIHRIDPTIFIQSRVSERLPGMIRLVREVALLLGLSQILFARYS